MLHTQPIKGAGNNHKTCRNTIYHQSRKCKKNVAIVALETALCCKYSLLIFFEHSMWFWWLGGTWAYFFWRDDDFKIFVYIRKRWFYCRDGADGKVCSLLCSSIRAFQKPIAVPHALACSPPFTKSFRDWSTVLCDVLQMFVACHLMSVFFTHFFFKHFLAASPIFSIYPTTCPHFFHLTVGNVVRHSSWTLKSRLTIFV